MRMASNSHPHFLSFIFISLTASLIDEGMCIIENIECVER